MSDHEHAAPLRVIERGLHHEELHRLRWVTSQELDQRLPERTASLKWVRWKKVKRKGKRQ